jgi:DNA-binding NarL/FixJ family response regulator
MSPIRVLVADHDPLVRTRLRTVLAEADDMAVVGEAADGKTAIEAMRRRPDVVLLELRLPGFDALSTLERIRATRRPPAVLALAAFDSDHRILQALRHGAAGFLLRSARPAELLRLIRVAADGHVVISPEASHRLLAAAIRRSGPRDERLAMLDGLSAQETEVLTGLGEVLSDAEIAARLEVPEATVKACVSRILAKLRCAHRTHAGLLAYERGLCRPG